MLFVVSLALEAAVAACLGSEETAEKHFHALTEEQQMEVQMNSQSTKYSDLMEEYASHQAYYDRVR